MEAPDKKEIIITTHFFEKQTANQQQLSGRHKKTGKVYAEKSESFIINVELVSVQ
jgi:hypothetical protein